MPLQSTETVPALVLQAALLLARMYRRSLPLGTAIAPMGCQPAPAPNPSPQVTPPQARSTAWGCGNPSAGSSIRFRRCPGSSGGRVPGSAAPPGLAAAGSTVRPGGTGMNPTGSRAPGSRCAHRAGLTGFSYAQSAVSTLGYDLLSCHTTAGRSLGPFSRASPHRNCGLCLGVSSQDSWPNRVDNDNKSAVLAIAERCLHTVKASSVNHSAPPSK